MSNTRGPRIIRLTVNAIAYTSYNKLIIVADLENIHIPVISQKVSLMLSARKKLVDGRRCIRLVASRLLLDKGLELEHSEKIENN